MLGDMREFREPRDVLALGPPWWGLPASEGMRRRVNGWGGGDNTAHLNLNHGWASNRYLDVDIEIGHQAIVDDDVQSLQRWFTRRIHGARITAEHFPLRFEVLRTPTTIPVDGESTEFIAIGDELSWVAHATIADRFVRLHGVGLDLAGLELVTVDPLNEYEIR
jgi:hypothetical protein